jgi:hypothetical protein
MPQFSNNTEVVKVDKDRQQHETGVPAAVENRKPWQEPKLAFVEPTLTKHGELTEVTGQFFTVFTP